MDQDSQSSPNDTDYLSPQTVSIVVALVVLLLSIIFYLTSKKSSRKSILLLGLADSGKTTLFTQLSYGSYTQTLTSMKENEEQIPVKGGNRYLTLVDTPGFDRLRSQLWEQFKPRARGIIFVVDSVTFMANIHNVADLLYDYLCDESVISNRTPFLIACTKQDETRVKTSKVIHSQLEKEFHTIRETRIGALDSTDADRATRRILGNPSQTFSFSQLNNPIEFADCSAANNAKQLDNVHKWIESIA